LDTFEFLNLKWQGLQSEKSWYKEGRASKVESEKAGEDQKRMQKEKRTKSRHNQSPISHNKNQTNNGQP
jgi:hypothetical protein